MVFLQNISHQSLNIILVSSFPNSVFAPLTSLSGFKAPPVITSPKTPYKVLQPQGLCPAFYDKAISSCIKHYTVPAVLFCRCLKACAIKLFWCSPCKIFRMGNFSFNSTRSNSKGQARPTNQTLSDILYLTIFFGFKLILTQWKETVL